MPRRGEIKPDDLEQLGAAKDDSLLPIVLTQPRTIGDAESPAGTLIAEVRLHGVSLNYLVDALRTNLATDATE